MLKTVRDALERESEVDGRTFLRLVLRAFRAILPTNTRRPPPPPPVRKE